MRAMEHLAAALAAFVAKAKVRRAGLHVRALYSQMAPSVGGNAAAIDFPPHEFGGIFRVPSWADCQALHPRRPTNVHKRETADSDGRLQDAATLVDDREGMCA